MFIEIKLLNGKFHMAIIVVHSLGPEEVIYPEKIIPNMKISERCVVLDTTKNQGPIHVVTILNLVLILQ